MLCACECCWYIVVCELEAQIIVQLPPNLVPVASNPGGGTWDFFPCLGAVFGLPSIIGNLENLKDVPPCVLFHCAEF
jgi:hypothetical protein